MFNHNRLALCVVRPRKETQLGECGQYLLAADPPAGQVYVVL